jgi:hypothetical protein
LSFEVGCIFLQAFLGVAQRLKCTTSKTERHQKNACQQLSRRSWQAKKGKTMNENYHKSAKAQDPQFLGAPKPAVENQPPSALCERDAGATAKTITVDPRICLFCGEPLRVIRDFAKGRGFEMRCDGSDSNPHRTQAYVKFPRKEDAERFLSGVRCK